MDQLLKSMGLKVPPMPTWLAQAADDIKSLLLTGSIEPPIMINGIQYHLDETIGEGGYSMVYSAREVTASGEEPKECMAIKETVLGTSEANARYEAELETLMSLQHPNILQLLGHSRVKNQATNEETGYFLTPLSTGNLENLVTFRRLTIREVLMVVSSICSALAYCHEDKKRSHRDIKASNVLITHLQSGNDDADDEEGERERPPLKDDETMILSVVLCDWGSAGPAQQPLPTTRQEALLIQEWAEANVTSSYRALELWDVQHIPDGPSTSQETPFQQPPTPHQLTYLDWAAADIWAVGCVLFAAMYGGQAPYHCDRGGSVPLAALSRSVKFPYPKDDPRCYPLTFHDRVMACLEIDPASRPTAREMQAWAEEEIQKLIKHEL